MFFQGGLASIVHDPDYSGKLNEVTSGNALNFLRPISKQQSIIIEFYAPWCGHCQQFRPVYEEIAKELSKDGEYRFGACDITQNGAMSGRFDIREIPALYLYKGGELFKYSGPFNAHAVKVWAKTDYKSLSPLPFWTSPLGPFGKLKGLFIHIGVKLVEFVPKLASRLGLPDYMGVVLIACALGLSILGCTFLSVYVNISHAKRD